MEELPNKPLLVGEQGVSMSLAGVQTKLAVAVDDTGRVCIPMNGSPSTHILKPASPRLWGSVQNEAFCLTLARRMKIPTLKITTAPANEPTYSRSDTTECAPMAVGVACTRRTIVKPLGYRHPPSTNPIKLEFLGRR